MVTNGFGDAQALIQHLHLQQQVETTERICKQTADCV